MNGVWSTVEIGGKTADIYNPPGGRPRFGVLHLHGYSLKTLRDETAFSRWFDEFNLSLRMSTRPAFVVGRPRAAPSLTRP